MMHILKKKIEDQCTYVFFIVCLQDPILNPSLVTEHPTARQDLILKQLSTLKQVGIWGAEVCVV